MDQQKLASLIQRYEETFLFVTRKVTALITEHVKDLTHEQYFAVRFIKNRGPCTPSELAEACGVNRSAITAMVDRLVVKGFVKRARNEDDRRVVYLETTEAGDRVYLEGEEKIRQLVEFYLQELEDNELEAFIRIYEKISSIIRNNGGI